MSAVNGMNHHYDISGEKIHYIPLLRRNRLGRVGGAGRQVQDNIRGFNVYIRTRYAYCNKNYSMYTRDHRG